ncbi:MAG: replicative DNA helicase [Ruminococcaceae bacterium]|nr:replicative DNA helicase [Oscillospiraceae bacterium]
MAENDFQRKLPAHLEAEQALLGSILIDPKCLNEVAGIIKVEDFYFEHHADIYLVMQEMYLKNQDIDAVTLIDALVRHGVYDESTSKSYIKLIIDVVPDVANVKDYAKIVKDKSKLRALISAAGEITESAYAAEDDVDHIIGNAEQLVFDISASNVQKGFVHIRDSLISVYEHLHLLQTNREETMGTPTGFGDLDNVLVGMGKGDFIIVGARPGVGKTSFTLNIASNVAKNTKKAVCVFSLEMSADQLVSRMLSSEALVDSHNIRSGELTDEDWDKLAHASANLSECDIWIDDTTGITATAMKAKLRRVKNLGLVVIDYLQLMQCDRRIDNRVLEVADISRNLKILAKELQIPIICCAQLSRSPESRTDKTPMLSDLRDSGAIEQDADMIMFLSRDYYNTDPDKQNVADVIIAKNRHGSTGKVTMGWFGQFTKFTSLAPEEGAPPM